MSHQSIKVDNIDIDLLRQQRDFLLFCFENCVVSDPPYGTRVFTNGEEEFLDGMINLIDNMLDTAEGVDKC